MKNTRQKQEKHGPEGYIRPVLISTGVGIGTTAAMLFLFAFVLSIKDLPHAAIEPLAILAVIAGSLCAGFVCSRLCKEKGLLLGTICGLILFGLLVLSSLMVSDDGFGMTAWFKLAITGFSGAIGGVVGVNVRVRRK